ncbi:MAG: TonB-dependent receptor [Dysgonamonadaceae bacterium]|nr:TonB-dependent receptor [Dysgonamonadaceae bacterium]
MKIALIAGLLFSFQAYALEYAEEVTISLHLKNATIEEVFKAIESQTEFSFFYEESEINTSKKVDLDVDNERINSVLDKILDKNAISYKITDRHIVLYKAKDEKPSAKSKENLQQPQPQTIIVRGQVTDKQGEPLIGVSVYTSPQNGTATDIDGRFTLTAKPGESITFVYIGYATQILPAKQTLNVIMLDDAKVLDEVVVVAYGQQKKVSVTAAISSVGTQELKLSPVPNFSDALQGRLPGLTTLQTSGQPGNDEVTMYIRGAATLNGQSPLILIDGIERRGENMAKLDPNEVQSVTILKDASATAVFGVRGANGVILITTRRGQTGKMELNLSANYSVQTFLAQPDRLHSWEYADLRNQAYINTYGATPADQLPFTPYMIEKYKDGSDRVFYPDRDVFHDYFKDYAPQSRINMNMNGGGEDFKYFLNAGWTYQGGNVITEPKSKLGYDPSFSMDRFNFRGNIDYNITKNLLVAFNIASYIENMNSPNTGADGMYTIVADMMKRTWSTVPTEPGPLTAAGYGVAAGEVVSQTGLNDGNAYDRVNFRGYERNTSTTLNTNLSLDWKLDFITKGLSAKGLVAFDSYGVANVQASRGVNIYGARVAKSATDTPSGYYVLSDNNDIALSLDKTMGTYYYLNAQGSLNYDRTFGKHQFTGLALVQRDNRDSDYNPWGTDVPYNLIGFVGRATYNYDNRYLAEFNIGYNGTEQFAPKNRFGTFPAYSLGWVASNEKFMEHQRVISNLKFRVSYGKTGNDQLGASRFLYVSKIYTQGGMFESLGRGQAIVQGYVGNENIQWEVATKKNLGIDLGLFNTISFTADYFTEHRDKILMTQNSLPLILGLNNIAYNPYKPDQIPPANIGIVDNKGFEMELGYQKIFSKDFGLNVKGNFAYNKNVVVFMDEVEKTSDYAYTYRQTGYSIGQQWGYLIDYSNGNGYINTAEELATLPKYDIGTPQLGDFMYVDLNGDGHINDKDMAPIGYPTIPRVTFGFSASANYKNFDVSFLFSGIGQSSYYLMAESGEGVNEIGAMSGQGFYTDWHLKAWTQERYENGEEILYPALRTNLNYSNNNPNSHFIANRAFLRMKNAEIGYTLPSRWTKALTLTNARIYFSGQNLLTWDKYPIKTVDPEQTGTLVYGLTRNFNVGVNITF